MNDLPYLLGPLASARVMKGSAEAGLMPEECPCSICGTMLVISATGMRMIRGGKARPACHRCVPTDSTLGMTRELAEDYRKVARWDAERN